MLLVSIDFPEPIVLAPKDISFSHAFGDLQCLIFLSCDFVKVVSLKSLLARTVAEKNALLNVRSENIQLHEQVARLEERLRESDAEIQAQLRIYTAEVEDFQASLDGLKSENEFTVNQIPVDEMSWEIWSELLLRIDTLMLDDFLSQVRKISRKYYEVLFILLV